MEARACGTRPGNDKTPLPFIPSFSSNTNRAQCPYPCPCPHTPLPPPPPRPTRGLETLLATRHASLNWFGGTPLQPPPRHTPPPKRPYYGGRISHGCASHEYAS